MTLESILALALAVLVLAASPGPGVFATVARALASGFRKSLFVIAGIVLGDLLFLLLAVFGMTVVARVMGEFFFLIRLAGGAYLVWLGIRIWRAEPVLPEAGKERAGGSNRGHFISGLLITLGNPKVILFYAGFLPTFMDLSRLTPGDVQICAAVVAGVLSAVMAAYAFMASRARRLFTRPLAVRRLNRCAGGVMVGAGVVIATR